MIIKWLARKVEKELLEEETNAKKQAIPHESVESVLSRHESLRINVAKANGGFVIKFVGDYDITKDREESSLHIITEDKNFNEELGTLITQHLLRTG